MTEAPLSAQELDELIEEVKFGNHQSVPNPTMRRLIAEVRAARQQSAPSVGRDRVRPADIRWLQGIVDAGHVGEGNIERSARYALNERVERILDALLALPLHPAPNRIDVIRQSAIQDLIWETASSTKPLSPDYARLIAAKVHAYVREALAQTGGVSDPALTSARKINAFVGDALKAAVAAQTGGEQS